MELLRDIAVSAERILVPKSRDALSAVAAFTETTGVEVPLTVWDTEYVRSNGRSFRLVPGSDMSSQIAAGWGDIAICSTELVAEAGVDALQSIRVGKSICRYSILALEESAEDWRAFLERTSRYARNPRYVPASFPNYLGMIAAGRDLPLVPMRDISISGKGEATMRDSGIGAVADRVVSGETARKLGALEVFELAKIYPEVIFRRQDADAYKPAA